MSANNPHYWLLCLLLAGCAQNPPAASTSLNVSATLKKPPIVAELGYASIRGRQETAIETGGYQHALVVSVVDGGQTRIEPGHFIKKIDPTGLFHDKETVFFGYDSNTLSRQEQSKLREFLNRVGIANISALSIEGHTNAIGSESYNQSLPLQRAAEVRQYLTQLGVPQPLMTTRGFGESMPAVPNDSERNRAKNRRADVITRK